MDESLFWVVLGGCFISSIAQLIKIRILLEEGQNMPRVSRTAADMAAGALGYFSYAMLLTVIRPDYAIPEFLLGTAAVVGWIGGDLFLSLGRFLQYKLGIPLGIPERRGNQRDD